MATKDSILQREKLERYYRWLRADSKDGMIGSAFHACTEIVRIDRELGVPKRTKAQRKAAIALCEAMMKSKHRSDLRMLGEFLFISFADKDRIEEILAESKDGRNGKR